MAKRIIDESGEPTDGQGPIRSGDNLYSRDGKFVAAAMFIRGKWRFDDRSKPLWGRCEPIPSDQSPREMLNDRFRQARENAANKYYSEILASVPRGAIVQMPSEGKIVVFVPGTKAKR